MSPRRLLRWTFAALAVAALSGCMRQVAGVVYENDADNQPVPFPGLYSYLNDKQPTRILWVHGMCHHHGDWAKKRMEQLGRLLGGTYDADAFKPVFVPGTPVQVYAGDIRTAKGVASVKMIVGSSLTLAAKQTLCSDSRDDPQSDEVCPPAPPGGGYPYQRASLNNKMKSGLMNTCLSDAILYVGERGEAMRDAMTRALCVAAGGVPSDAACNAPDGVDLNSSPLLLVAESLGSKMIADAAERLVLKAGGPRALQQTLGNTRMIYLLANQIPMLDLAEPEVGAARAGRGGLRGLVNLAMPRAPGRSAPLDLRDQIVVAFTDPNDVLSYRLNPGHFLPRTDVRVANVISSNAGTLLGFVEDPYKAHMGYLDNPDAAAALICGNAQPQAPCPARR